eukprot:gene9061-6359_t
MVQLIVSENREKGFISALVLKFAIMRKDLLVLLFFYLFISRWIFELLFFRSMKQEK